MLEIVALHECETRVQRILLISFKPCSDKGCILVLPFASTRPSTKQSRIQIPYLASVVVVCCDYSNHVGCALQLFNQLYNIYVVVWVSTYTWHEQALQILVWVPYVFQDHYVKSLKCMNLSLNALIRKVDLLSCVEQEGFLSQVVFKLCLIGKVLMQS